MLPSGRLKWCTKVVPPKPHCNLPWKDKNHGSSRETKHQLKPLMLNLTLGSDIVEQVREHEVLGVTLEEELTWQSQLDNVCKQLKIYFCL